MRKSMHGYIFSYTTELFLLGKCSRAYLLLKVTVIQVLILCYLGEGNGNLLQYSCLENPLDGGTCWAAVHGVAQSRTRLKRLSMHACIGEGNGNHSSILAWRIPGTEEPGGLLSMGSHRVRHNQSNLAAAAAAAALHYPNHCMLKSFVMLLTFISFHLPKTLKNMYISVPPSLCLWS